MLPVSYDRVVVLDLEARLSLGAGEFRCFCFCFFVKMCQQCRPPRVLLYPLRSACQLPQAEFS